jgi:hypothetical protein
MRRRQFILAASTVVGLAVITACGGGEGDTQGQDLGQTTPEAQLLEVKFGAPAGGVVGAWEPKILNVPVNRPFKIKFTPTDQRLHVIVSNELKLELEVKDGQSVESAALTVKDENKVIDIFCREHRGAGGFGTIIGVR